jgi:hypothetical protein
MFLWLFCLMLFVCFRWLAKMLAARSRVNKYVTVCLPGARVERVGAVQALRANMQSDVGPIVRWLKKRSRIT